MKQKIVHTDGAVLLVGGGPVDLPCLQAHARTGVPVVAADGGAAVLLDNGIMPQAVIGDMDSLSVTHQAALPAHVLYPVAEQDSTDFDKALRHIEAPLVLGYGFVGARLDHTLAALTVLARYPERRCVLVGDADVAVLCPPRLHLPLEAGRVVSLWPLAPVTGRSDGLRWPIDGLHFAPDRMGGTSNEALGPVRLEIDAPAMVLMLPVACLSLLQPALTAEPSRWPARA